jgi:hypothetical protein
MEQEMNLILKRVHKLSHGIFGFLYIEKTTQERLAVTLEHAYMNEKSEWYAKVPAGKYLCKRGLHKLPNMDHNFETFEVTNVPGHWGILFHVGNFNKDSEGCILLGREFNNMSEPRAISGSRSAFAEFMGLQGGLAEFYLTVED